MMVKICPPMCLAAVFCLLATIAAAQNPSDTLPYQFKSNSTLEAQIKHAQRLKTAGIVLTCAAPVLEAGALVAFAYSWGRSAKYSTATQTGNYYTNKVAAPLFYTLGALGPAAFLSGVPLLVTGAVKLRHFRKLQQPVTTQTGLLPDGTVGLNLQF
ncbi:MAG TPA: hypothetical protein VG603_13890 [Chitinophagales bacterium]|nr:hypothetical protein [Chitinophagales bacterium]